MYVNANGLLRFSETCGSTKVDPHYGEPRKPITRANNAR